ncbi:type I-E CRISPR-associated protein Cas6/Cse3/CasE [Brevibacterium sp.]|uniref:type I-E CRISPR-associated protein Cas6/Cse3/CasE n=1 Tax=Brevibacterium sp. TaxID=1701 RepID=UPI002811FF31|nr:type I-E CRISPR-associated protein Cas6/Cse3/CasE [Brevibacterium sp.]
MLHQVHTTVSPYVRDALRENRERAHTHIMSAFPRVDGTDSPRAAMSILWYLDDRAQRLTVQSAAPPTSPGLLGEVESFGSIEMPRQGDHLTISVFRNCQKTPPSRTPEELRSLLKQGKAYRSRMIIVPEEERTEWAAKRLSAIGLIADPGSLKLGPLVSARLGGRRQKVPAVEITAQCIVAEAEQLSASITKGVGKAKNYGLGLLRVRTD